MGRRKPWGWMSWEKGGPVGGRVAPGGGVNMSLSVILVLILLFSLFILVWRTNKVKNIRNRYTK